MDKKINKELVLERIMYDKKLNANQIRTILYALKNEYFTSNQIIELFECNLQYANQIIVSLERKNYLKKHTKLPSTRRYIYTIVDDVAPTQTNIFDFESTESDNDER